jgi:hypothetical protein
MSPMNIDHVYSSVIWYYRWMYGAGESQTGHHTFVDVWPKPTNINYIRWFRVSTNILSRMNKPTFPIVRVSAKFYQIGCTFGVGALAWYPRAKVWIALRPWNTRDMLLRSHAWLRRSIMGLTLRRGGWHWSPWTGQGLVVVVVVEPEYWVCRWLELLDARFHILIQTSVPERPLATHNW